jgi:hypothetical protein
MMTVYPGDLRIFRFTNRYEVFLPTSDEEIVRLYRALDRDLPRRFVPMIEALDDVFPSVAAAYRRIGITEPIARIGSALGEYEEEPDPVVRQICQLLGAYDLRLTFRGREELDCFLQAYEIMPAAPETV